MTEEKYRAATNLLEKKKRLERIIKVLSEPDSKTVISSFSLNEALGSYKYDLPILEMVKRSYQGLLADVNKEFEAL